MKKFKDIPLKYQLIATIFSISFISLWLACSAFIFYDHHAYKENMVHELTVLARIIANRSTAAVLNDDVDETKNNLDVLGVKSSIEFACITNNFGELMAFYSRNPIAEESARKDCLHDQDFISRFYKNHLELLQPISIDRSEKIADLYIREDLSALNKRFQVFSAVIMLILILVSVIAIVLSSKIQHFFSEPLISLTQISERITKENNYSLRVAESRADEIGRLFLAFNSMVKTIEEKNQSLLDAKDSLEGQVETRTAELRNINRELEAFTYSVSHDLRSPLRAIDGFSAAVIEDCGDQINDVGNEYLKRIRAASQQMGLLIEGLLSLSRVSRQEMNLQSIDLVPVAQEIVRRLNEQNPDREFRFVCPSTLLAYGDKTLLMITLENLLGNAWKYSAKVHIPLIELGSMDRNGEVVYFVRDNGAGFNMKFVNKLFGPFQRLHRADEFDGLGIGLATLSRIIHRHEGEIWAEGVVGVGATFYFTLGARRQA